MCGQKTPDLKTWLGWAALALLAVAVAGAVWRAAFPLWSWLIMLAAGALALPLAGYSTQQTVLAVIVGPDNRASLERLQTVLWTLLLLPAVLAVGACRLYSFAHPKVNPAGAVSPTAKATTPGHPDVQDKQPADNRVAAFVAVPRPAEVKDPAKLTAGDVLQFDIPPQAWVLLGISYATLLAAGAIKRSRMEAGDPRFAAKDGPVDATLWDLVTVTKDNDNQEDVRLDLAKIQNLTITLMAVGLYATLLATVFHGHHPDAPRPYPDALPAFTGSLLILIGVSHAYFLTAMQQGQKPTSASPTPPSGLPVVRKVLPSPVALQPGETFTIFGERFEPTLDVLLIDDGARLKMVLVPCGGGPDKLQFDQSALAPFAGRSVVLTVHRLSGPKGAQVPEMLTIAPNGSAPT